MSAKRERAQIIAYLWATADKIERDLRDDDDPTFRMHAITRADALEAAAQAIARGRHLRKEPSDV